MTEKLRFAPLIRVSTESQEKRGESLNVQKNQITGYVEFLNGTIPDSCWKYSGQEHATPDQERAKLDRLLKDSSNGKFDAVIVCDASRWSRDNLKSKEGLQLLKENGVRFFVGTTEYNLYNPEQFFFLSLAVEIGEFHANQQTLKSIVSRIERAKKGVPTSGKLPYGRTFDKKTEQWGVDEEKKQIIERAAREYLETGQGGKIAKRIGMNYPNLLKILKHRSGDKWEVKFRSKKLNIEETVHIKIPRLLPEEVIQAIHRRAEANKTFAHGQTKYPYPLARMVFCSECGFAIFGQVNHNERRYYRHPRNRGCKIFNSIPAETVEDSVLFNLWSIFGDKAKMEQAANDAIPNFEEVEKIKKQIASDHAELKKIKQDKKRLIEAIKEVGIQDGDLKRDYKALAEREILLNEEIKDLSEKISEFPTEKEIKDKAGLIQRITENYFRGPDHLREMSMDDKRAFFQSVFNGKDRDGKRYGVYVSQYEKPDGEINWEFQLTGNLITPGINDKFHPLFKGEREAIADVPEGFFDEDQDKKEDGPSQCHAHYRFCLHQRR